MAGFSFRPKSYEEGASREWLLANGLGGYASSTAVVANTRAYHGLLVAALAPPADRWLLLSSLDEEIEGACLAQSSISRCDPSPGVQIPAGVSFGPNPPVLLSDRRYPGREDRFHDKR